MPPTQSNPFTDKATSSYLILAFLLGAVVFFLAQSVIKPPPAEAKSTVRDTTANSYNISRVTGFRNIKPVLFVEPATKSERFAPMKIELKKLIESLKMAGTITQASVFLQEFDKGEWTSVNRKEKYHPASLMKVALLIGYLRIAEAQPGLLKQEWKFDKPANASINPQYYTSKSIVSGQKYTVHELLYYMVAHSDNNATWLLASHFDNSMLKKLFAEFGLPEPIEDDEQFTMTAKEYSVFFNAIYNSANLSPEYADYAADLLSNCDFNKGFVAGFPPKTQMWHKFGEWRSVGHDYELHESGIVHLKGKPYLITIMTRGKDIPKQAEAIQAICRKIYEKIPSP